jgi:CheY-like chemotaxis protein
MSASVASAKPFILVVEDDDELRDIVAEILEAEGYEVIPARHGQQVLDYLRCTSSLPALVLLDLMMPIVNGWECLRAIKADERLRSIPVVLMSALAGDRPGNADAVLRKPLRIDQLLDVVTLLVETAPPESAHPSPR